MRREELKSLVDAAIRDEGTVETGVKGVQLFRVTTSLCCAPAVYEPTLIAIVSGEKEAILAGERHTYDANHYMCCTMSMPVEAGTPTASPDNPLLGVQISLDRNVLTKLTIEMESASGAIQQHKGSTPPRALTLASWDDAFTDALLRLLQLANNPAATAVLGEGRLRELYYAVLKGGAGDATRRAFGVGNEVARAIEYFSSRLGDPVTIEEMAAHVGMSRAVFHRKFKQATLMSPIQFLKSTRLNSAAMKIATGMNVSEAAAQVGYVSSSQFSREFKRLYGQSPKQWSHAKWLSPDASQRGEDR